MENSLSCNRIVIWWNMDSLWSSRTGKGSVREQETLPKSGAKFVAELRRVKWMRNHAWTAAEAYMKGRGECFEAWVGASRKGEICETMFGEFGTVLVRQRKPTQVEGGVHRLVSLRTKGSKSFRELRRSQNRSGLGAINAKIEKLCFERQRKPTQE